MSQHVLLVAPDPVGTTLAQNLQQTLCLEVTLCTVGRDGATAVRREEFTLVLLDESMAAIDPLAAGALYADASSTPILEMNFAISSAERVIRHVRGALLRRAHDEAKARTAAATTLGNQLNASITGLLLESQLALPKANPDLARALQQIIKFASEVRGHMSS